MKMATIGKKFFTSCEQLEEFKGNFQEKCD